MKFINHAEGHLEPDGTGGFDYVYQYKDHLGNIRLSYSDRNNDGQISDTPIFEDDFESASGWESQGFAYGAAVDAYDNSFSHSGNYATRIDTPEGDAKYVHSNTWITIDNEQATAYTYSGWAYSDGPGIRVMLFMNTEEETDYYTQLDVFSDYETTNEWVYFEKTVMVPANIKRLNIRIESFWTAPGHVWFDDIQIKGQDSEIVEENNYYPFGLKHKGYNNIVSGGHYPYGFNGKEENEELGLQWLDFGWRNYSPDLGRWMNMDPLAEFTRKYSPYSYALNNPIYFIDIAGLTPDGSLHIADYYGDGAGNIIYDPDVHEPKDVPKGGTYLGSTYTDPITGTFWDENGNPHTQTQNLGEVTVTGTSNNNSRITRDGVVVWGVGGAGISSTAGGGIVRGTDRGSGSIQIGGSDINPFFGLIWLIMSGWFPEEDNTPKPNESTMEKQPEAEPSQQHPHTYFLDPYKNGSRGYPRNAYSSKKAEAIKKAKNMMKQNDEVDSVKITGLYLRPIRKDEIRTGRDTTIIRN